MIHSRIRLLRQVFLATPDAAQSSQIIRRLSSSKRVPLLSQESSVNKSLGPVWIKAAGNMQVAPLKVQQVLMRRASFTTTMNVYGKPMSSIKRKANSRVVSTVLKKHKRKLLVAAS